MKLYRTAFLILFVGASLTISSLSAQQPSGGFKSDEALSAEGVKKIDEGKYDEAIAIFDKLIARDSLKPEYRYEKALALYLKRDYKNAITLLERLAEGAESNPQYYQLLGNSYDFLDQKEKAIDAYQAGLRRFPHSGRLFSELGTIEMTRHDFGQALQYWETGITAEPGFATNYYWAAKFTGQTREKIWALLYGELFLQLEPDTKRAAEISEVLFKTYKNVIAASQNGILKFSFERTILVGEQANPSREPLEVAFDKTMTGAGGDLLKNGPNVTLQLIHDLRVAFHRQWAENGYSTAYRNILFEQHEKMIQAGVFKAYNMWLMRHGAPDEYKKWYESNKPAFKKFHEWVQKNPLVINEQNYFSRYD
jgi:tetratricopeptide (TPR) repeat protein